MLSPVRGGFGTTRKSPFELAQSVPDFTSFDFKNFRYTSVAAQKLHGHRICLAASFYGRHLA